MALPHQRNVNAVLNRQAAYLQAHCIGQRAPGVGDHGHAHAAEHEGQQTLAMLDLDTIRQSVAAMIASATLGIPVPG